VLEASESRTADAAGRSGSASTETGDRLVSYRHEVSSFCAAIRAGTPLACGPDRAMHSAVACLRADEAVEQKARLEIGPGVPTQSTAAGSAAATRPS
jgi:hypothetical protein